MLVYVMVLMEIMFRFLKIIITIFIIAKKKKNIKCNKIYRLCQGTKSSMEVLNSQES